MRFHAQDEEPAVAFHAEATPVIWGEADQLGPDPRPDWLVVDDAVAVDLGVLKSGKEADVHVVRWVARGPPCPPRILPAGGQAVPARRPAP